MTISDDLTNTVPVPGWMWQLARWLIGVLGAGLVGIVVVLVNAAISFNGRLTEVEGNTKAHDTAVAAVRTDVQTSLAELKSEMRSVNTTVTTLQRDFDRKFGATP